MEPQKSLGPWNELSSAPLWINRSTHWGRSSRTKNLKQKIKTFRNRNRNITQSQGTFPCLQCNAILKLKMFVPGSRLGRMDGNLIVGWFIDSNSVKENKDKFSIDSILIWSKEANSIHFHFNENRIKYLPKVRLNWPSPYFCKMFFCNLR